LASLGGEVVEEELGDEPAVGAGIGPVEDRFQVVLDEYRWRQPRTQG
jgi:hypothetical protein